MILFYSVPVLPYLICFTANSLAELKSNFKTDPGNPIKEDAQELGNQ